MRRKEKEAMMDAAEQKKKIFRKVVRIHPVKLTALLYLKQALLKEKYEMCADIIAIAKEFGARDYEIQNLLEDPRRNPT